MKTDTISGIHPSSQLRSKTERVIDAITGIILPPPAEKTVPDEFLFVYHDMKFPLKNAPKIKLEQNSQTQLLQVPNSLELPVITDPPQGIEISNFHMPYGSIGLKTPTSDAIYTQKLLQCAGLAIYDPKEGTQSLIHIFHKTPTYKVKEGLQAMIPKDSLQEPDRLKIDIINGCELPSEATINKILGALYIINPETTKNVSFRHFPDTDNMVLCMQNGKLFATQNVNSSTINPDEIVSFH